MIRREQVHPNDAGVVTLDMLIEAAIRGCTMLDFAGGTFSIVTDRQPTGFPGEMQTVKAAIEWRHDARVQPRPEQFEQPVAVESRADEQHEREVMETPGVAEGAEAALEELADLKGSDEPDGFDYSRLDEEDVEEPVSAS